MFEKEGLRKVRRRPSNLPEFLGDVWSNGAVSAAPTDTGGVEAWGGNPEEYFGQAKWRGKATPEVVARVVEAAREDVRQRARVQGTGTNS